MRSGRLPLPGLAAVLLLFLLPALAWAQATPSAAAAPATDATLGFTFFHGSLGTVEEAQAIGASPGGWARNERVFLDVYLPKYHLEGTVERTLGLWEHPEPSYTARLRGRREDILELARHWGTDYDQEAMAVLFRDPNAPGGVLRWDLGRALEDRAFDALLEAIGAIDRRLAEQARQQGREPDMTIGVTVLERRILEHWVDSAATRDRALPLLQEALATAGLGSAPHTWTGGFEFVLLWAGSDYPLPVAPPAAPAGARP